MWMAGKKKICICPAPIWILDVGLAAYNDHTNIPGSSAINEPTDQIK
jgi:hypothetical protein